MLVLGLSGFLGTGERDSVPEVPASFFHDAAACLVSEAGVVAAVEEERINRRKHTNLFPLGAVRACLEQAGASLADVDRVAYFFAEGFTDVELLVEYARQPHLPVRAARELIAQRLGQAAGTPPAPAGDPRRLVPRDPAAGASRAGGVRLSGR